MRVVDTEGSAKLVKLAYRGSPSRAEFPLTEDFALHSNNSRVGLTGRARVIQDVAEYVKSGGEYYTCDLSVQSEACLPLFGVDGAVCGIVDVETALPHFFTGHTLAATIAFALTAQALVRDFPASD